MPGLRFSSPSVDGAHVCVLVAQCSEHECEREPAIVQCRLTDQLLDGLVVTTLDVHSPKTLYMTLITHEVIFQFSEASERFPSL